METKNESIRLVDGAIKTIRMINNRSEFEKILVDIDNEYRKLGTYKEVLDGYQGEFDSDYYKRWHNEQFNDWHIGHARNLINRTGCKSVLEVGCGMGNIVRGFLKNGIDSWGMDISDYVVENCGQELRRRIIWGDISKENTLPKSDNNNGIVKRYDLVIGYDIFEHVPNPDIVVHNFCNLAGNYIHVKVPDIRGLNLAESKTFDPTHITGRSIRWWIDKFEQEGFRLIFDNGYTWLKFDPNYALAPVGAPDLLGLFVRI